jgi:hypothetical protein
MNYSLRSSSSLPFAAKSHSKDSHDVIIPREVMLIFLSSGCDKQSTRRKRSSDAFVGIPRLLNDLFPLRKVRIVLSTVYAHSIADDLGSLRLETLKMRPVREHSRRLPCVRSSFVTGGHLCRTRVDQMHLKTQNPDR